MNYRALHRHAGQWRDPHAFEPERFNRHSEMWYKPGTQEARSPIAFLPFHGGKRICFGKILVDKALKILITYVLQVFDFKLAEEIQRGEFPKAHMGMSGQQPVMMTLKRNLEEN